MVFFHFPHMSRAVGYYGRAVRYHRVPWLPLEGTDSRCSRHLHLESLQIPRNVFRPNRFIRTFTVAIYTCTADAETEKTTLKSRFWFYSYSCSCMYLAIQDSYVARKPEKRTAPGAAVGVIPPKGDNPAEGL